LKKVSPDNFIYTKMQQLLSKRNHEVKTTKGGFDLQPLKKSRQVSYNQKEKHIQKMESKLMEKYRIGFSQLHKVMVLKIAQQEFNELHNQFF
tara:strand:- start:1189 stop:1464 length:276 start_codon:yes stop_codon:yes gene_type:complete